MPCLICGCPDAMSAQEREQTRLAGALERVQEAAVRGDERAVSVMKILESFGG